MSQRIWYLWIAIVSCWALWGPSRGEFALSWSAARYSLVLSSGLFVAIAFLPKIRADKLFFFIASIFAFRVLQLSLNLLIQPGPVILRDMYDYFLPIQALFCFIVGYTLAQNTRSPRPINLSIGIAGFVTFIFVLMQVFRPKPFYVEVASLYTNLSNVFSNRFAAPLTTPYDLAVLCGLFFYMAIATLFYTQNYRSRALCILVIASTLYALLGTQSRAVVGAWGLTLPFILLFIFFMRFKDSPLPQLKARTWVMLFFLPAIGLIPFLIPPHIIADRLSYLIDGFQRVFITGETLRPLELRKDQLMMALEQANTNLYTALMGNGPLKAEVRLLESAYAYYIFRYGFVGLLLYFFVPIVLCVVSAVFAYQQNKRCIHTSIFCLGAAGWMLLLPLASIANNFTEQIRLSYVFWILIGVCVGLNSRFSQKT